MERETKVLKLKEAIQTYLKEEKAISNSYDWYRKRAQEHGEVSMGESNIQVFKQKGVWYINENDFIKAIEAHRKAIEHLKQITADHDNGIIHGKDGDIVYMEGGGYKIHGNFRFAWSDFQRCRMKSDGTWHCNRCNIPAQIEHGKVECTKCGAVLVV